MSKKIDGLNIGRKIAREKYGECLSICYINNKTYMLWKCHRGHKWKAILISIVRGNWCQKCHLLKKNKKYKENAFNTCKIIANNNKGKCLDKEFKHRNYKMTWKCKNNHIWKSSFNQIKKGNWCYICRKNKQLKNLRLNGIRLAKNIARNKNGKCLSKTYINANKDMLWECKAKHQWSTSLHHIKRGSWCPICCYKKIAEANKLKNGIKIANDLAKTNNGKCLSKEYKNSLTKLEWKCKKGHVWRSKINNIKRGHWCPDCSRLNVPKTSRRRYTRYHWKTGEKLTCQGSWEFKVVEYFNKNRINFRWQPRSFKMPDGRKYHPDLYLFSTKKWIEIKGYFWDDAKEKWDWFQTIKPNSELWDRTKLKKIGIL